jgi:nitrogen regulatory protein P-II 1
MFRGSAPATPSTQGGEEMTKVECILRPDVVLEIKNALGKLGIRGMTVMEAIGFGSQKGYTEETWSPEFDINLLPKTKIEMVVSDDRLDEVVNVIIGIARTGQFGDGKIFTYPIGNAIRIRTGETGEGAV